MLVMLTELLSGLALFLFGMKFMSEGLQKAAGDKMRVILDRVTKNRFIAVIFGAIFTAIIQSSGATTVMEVSFVNAGLLTLEQSVGITFGANIGTTITAQLPNPTRWESANKTSTLTVTEELCTATVNSKPTSNAINGFLR